MNLITRIFSSLLIASFALAPAVSLAQQTVRGPDPLVIAVSPEVPSPGQSTTITISSTPLDLSRSGFIWKINGQIKASEAGLRSFTFTMGTSQSSTIISVTITPPGGETITRVFTFHPGSVTLLWEANTYTPPFYRGKSLYTPGADVRIVAVPDIKDQSGTPLAPSTLTYKWSVDDQNFADRSGLGKNTFYLSGAQLQPDQTVAVDVLRSNGIRAAHAEMTVPKSDAVVRLYKSDPLRGVLYNQAFINTARLTDTETTLLAEPYFISGTSREPSLVVYTWTLNDSAIEPQGKQRSLITLRQSNGQNGVAKLSLQIQNADLRRLLQQAHTDITLVFGNQNTGL